MAEAIAHTDADLRKKRKKRRQRQSACYFVAVHLGAGNHSAKKEKKYKILCNSACQKAISILRHGGSAEDAAVQATMILENSGIVNAGKGSNLTIDKKLECDAGFMGGNGIFGGVGAVPGIINPILAAQKLAEMQDNLEGLSCGRVPPNLLVGPGTKDWAISVGIPTCTNESMISDKTEKQYLKLMKKLEANDLKLKTQIDNVVSDTVGVITLDKFGHVGASVSSGGNWLKFSGRVGHAPQYGAGCWAADNRSPNQTEDSPAVAISTSGVGEILSKLHWAYECAKTLMDQSAIPVEGLKIELDKFLNNPTLNLHKEPKLLGVIGLIWDGQRGELVWGHTSNSFVLAYGGSNFKKIRMEFSTLRNEREHFTVGSASI